MCVLQPVIKVYVGGGGVNYGIYVRVSVFMCSLHGGSDYVCAHLHVGQKIYEIYVSVHTSPDCPCGQEILHQINFLIHREMEYSRF